MRTQNRLAELRRPLGLSQQDLARRMGVSRQALSTIESGRGAPSVALALRLAGVLGRRVEDLFWLDDVGPLQAHLAMPLTALRERRPLAGGPSADAEPARTRRALLGEVDGRWIAHAIAPGETSAFAAADALIQGNASSGRVRMQPLRPVETLQRNLLVAGCDPAIALLGARFADADPGARLAWLPAPSLAALDALARGDAHIAGAHLQDEASGEHNLSFVRRRFPGRRMVVVSLARWETGLAVARGNPLGIRGAADLARRGIRLADREPGCGARRTLERILRTRGLPFTSLRRTLVVSGHMAAAQAVFFGAADAGLTMRPAAAAFDLAFVPLGEDRFDLVVPGTLSGDARVARLIDILGGRAFQQEVAALDGYDVSHAGEIVAEVSG